VALVFFRIAGGDNYLDVYHWSEQFSPAGRMFGMPFQAGSKEMTAQELAPLEDSSALLAKTKPHLMMLMGYGGFIVTIWMMFKPF
jgi:hypothetical protein